LSGIRYIEGNEDLIEDVAPLWERLNVHHQAISTYFSHQIGQMTFTQRKSHWLEKVKTGQIRIVLAQVEDSKEVIGYCVTISNPDLGEIESIYVDKAFRKMGIGNCLMTKALNWLDRQSVKTKRVNVAVGNEQVFEFYGRYGFLPRATILEQKL
jgi:diamine N-acetyltransferase